MEFGCARFIYNTALSARNDACRWYGQSNNYVSLSKAIAELKRDSGFSWLKNATAACATQALIDLDKAFKNWREGRAAAPNFKKRSNKQSIRYQLDRYVLLLR